MDDITTSVPIYIDFHRWNAACETHVLKGNSNDELYPKRLLKTDKGEIYSKHVMSSFATLLSTVLKKYACFHMKCP